MKRHKYHPETEAVRGGTDFSRKNGPLATPIYQTATFEAVDVDAAIASATTDHFYTRYGNPTISVAEASIAALEGADAALLFASGMGAITATFMALVKNGDHIVAQRDIYGGAAKFLSEWLPRMGVETSFVDSTDYEQYSRAIRPNTRLLYLESPTNPTLKVIDLHRAVAIARDHNLISMIDSTFATPINQRPTEFGIDLVLHSGTKYFAGHSDVICGAAIGRRDLMQTIHETRTILGVSMDPHAAWLLLRGIKTLAVRVQRQNENALRIAEFLARHSKVRKVHYPFLEGHPQRALAMEQMRGGGGMMSFELDGSGEDARRFVESLRLCSLAASLGGVDSLVTIPRYSSHAMISEEQRKKMEISDSLIRLSVGIENVDDLIADLEQALAASGREATTPISVR
jgi:cystathionine beta-lyase/cystathionine gamma-synthase